MSTTSTQQRQGYAWVRQIRERLLTQIDTLRTVNEGFDGDTRRRAIADLRERVGRDDFEVLIAGEFSVGKSTTINAMLGQKVLPAYVTECTAVLTVVRWGEQPVARLFEMDRKATNRLSDRAVEIPIGELERHVTVDEDDPAKASRWGRAEINWPLEICRNGVSIVDSPGLNASLERNVITADYLARADAIVFVLDATRALAVTEREFLDNKIRGQGHEDVFFVVNKINLVDEPCEQERVRTQVTRKLARDWQAGPQRVFFVNARAALLGRQQGDAAAVAASGMAELEAELERFLSTNRARLKYAPPARQLQKLASEMAESVDLRLAMLDQGVEELRERYAKAQVPLQQAEKQRQMVVRLIDQHLVAILAEVQESARRCLTSGADACQQGAKELELTQKIGLNPFTAKQQIESAGKEIAERLDAQFQEHVAIWQRTALTELLNTRMEDLERDIDHNLREFIERIEEIKLSFAPVATDTAMPKQASGVERALAGVAGCVMDPGTALIGARFGFKQMLKGLGPQLGVAVVATLIGLTPLGIVAALFMSGMAASLFKVKNIHKRLAATVAGSIADEIRRNAPERAAKIANEVRVNLDAIRNAVDDSLGAHLGSIREDAEAALRKLTLGREEAALHKQQLAGYRATLRQIGDEAVGILTEFMIQR